MEDTKKIVILKKFWADHKILCSPLLELSMGRKYVHNINWELFLTIIINEFLTTSNVHMTENFEDRYTFFLNIFSPTKPELKFFFVSWIFFGFKCFVFFFVFFYLALTFSRGLGLLRQDLLLCWVQVPLDNLLEYGCMLYLQATTAGF